MDERDYKAMKRELNPPLQRCSVVRPLPTDDYLKKLFENNSDCYADTWLQDGHQAMVEGKVIQAMTIEQFIKVVKSMWE